MSPRASSHALGRHAAGNSADTCSDRCGVTDLGTLLTEKPDREATCCDSLPMRRQAGAAPQTDSSFSRRGVGGAEPADPGGARGALSLRTPVGRARSSAGSLDGEWHRSRWRLN